MRHRWRWEWVAALLLAMPAAADTPSRPERLPDHWRMMLRGITLHLPHVYTETVFGSDGFVIVSLASDGQPYNRQTDPFFPAGRLSEAVTMSVGGQRRFTGTDRVRRSILIRAQSNTHGEAHEEHRLDGHGWPVPQGLVYHRASGPSTTASGAREDMFVPLEPRRARDGSPLSEAIFCQSAHAPMVLARPPAERSRLRCEWMLVWRDIEVFAFLDRRHLAHWQGLRDRFLALLDSFVVDGPAEAGPPPDPWPGR